MPFFQRPDAARPLAFTFDDEAVDADESDTLATALLDAGLLMTSRSAKYRRPRGPYCLDGDCGSCLVRVDGEPNVRACMTPVAPGMTVRAQNTLRPKGFDPTQLVDRVFSKGFDHHHFMVKPRVANVLMQTVARELAGIGELPDSAFDGPAEHRHHTPSVLVLGLGPAGRAVCSALALAGVDYLAIERKSEAMLAAGARLELPSRAHLRTGVFAAYPGEALWAGTGREDRTHLLHTFRALHVVLALGSRDPMLPFPNNDVPGVVAARGLLRAMQMTSAKLAVPCVVVGRGPVAEQSATSLGVERIDPEEIEMVTGGSAVESVRLRGGREIECRLVAVAATPSPASDLAAQAGARLRWDGSGYPVVREESGRCGRFGGAQLWAVGDLTGWKGPEAAQADGARVGEQVVKTLEQLGGRDA